MGRPSDQQINLTGKLLLAHPSLRDPNFRRSIVFLLSHEAGQGAYGVIINRATEKALGDFLVDSELEQLRQLPVFLGGPVGVGNLILCSFTGAEEETISCEPNLSLPRAEEVLNGGIGVVRAFQGYAGWGDGQLEAEIQQNAWFVQDPFTRSLQLDRTAELWLKLISSLGPAYRLLAMEPDDPSLN